MPSIYETEYLLQKTGDFTEGQIEKIIEVLKIKNKNLHKKAAGVSQPGAQNGN